MKVWKIVIGTKNHWDNYRSYTYFGVASKVNVAVHQTLRLAKKEFHCIEIELVECLGDLDFCTKKI